MAREIACVGCGGDGRLPNVQGKRVHTCPSCAGTGKMIDNTPLDDRGSCSLCKADLEMGAPVVHLLVFCAPWRVDPATRLAPSETLVCFPCYMKNMAVMGGAPR